MRPRGRRQRDSGGEGPAAPTIFANPRSIFTLALERVNADGILARSRVPAAGLATGHARMAGRGGTLALDYSYGTKWDDDSRVSAVRRFRDRESLRAAGLAQFVKDRG